MHKKALREISIILTKIDDPDIIYDLLQQLLTPNESDELALRWEIVKLLNAGSSQREIAKKLKVSLCKITRGSKELKKENSVLLNVIRNL